MLLKIHLDISIHNDKENHKGSQEFGSHLFTKSKQKHHACDLALYTKSRRQKTHKTRLMEIK